MIPELTQLEYLIALAREENFTRAAAACHVTQQSLSAGIARLETLLATRLVERTTRRVQLTPAGRLLAERSASALGDIAQAVTQAQALAQGHTGRVTVGFHGPGADVAAPLLARFADTYPDIDVELRRADFIDPTAGVLDGSADVAVIAAPLEHPDLAAIPLLQEPLMFVLPAEHRLAGHMTITLADLAEVPIAEMANPAHDPLLDQWNRYWTLAEHRLGVPTSLATFTGVEEWLAGQRRGRYITTGPASAARLYPASGITYIPAEDLPPVTWRIIYKPHRLTAQARKLVELADQSTRPTGP